MIINIKGAIMMIETVDSAVSQNTRYLQSQSERESNARS